ncbi:MAG: VirB8/TrbF family protein [Vicinamibacteraceae bacterium]
MPATPPAKTVDSAKRQYVELFGSALVMNTYLRIALLCTSVIAVGLVGLCYWTVNRYRDLRPLVIRIDEVGRATAVQYDALTYRPREPELKYFLTQFVTMHYARRRATIKDTYPQSLLFLEPSLAEGLIAQANKTRSIEQFLVGTGDEIDIDVKNVTLAELKTPPYKAAVDFQKVYSTVGLRQEHRRETSVAQIEFVLRDQIPADLIPVNPLGLTITYFREDQAFR